MNLKRDARLSLAALGIVFGDIGTSPIYALRECFSDSHGLSPSVDNVLGLLSLIVWALILVVSVKYLIFVLRADNHGEGGIAALVALLNPWGAKRGSLRYVLMLMGLFGAALLYGDGTLTPAISVLSAVEGLKHAAPAFEAYVLPITLLILVALFWLQKRGTAGIGALFGPVIVLWFVVLAALGLHGIAQDPRVLMAVNPLFATGFLLHHGHAGFLVLGSVFLAVTGGEALYADMGHFGRRPIRLAWFILVLPALLLNYFGQGALYLHTAGGASDPFYQLAPDWALYPLIGLATLATIIASQAVISGTFSLTHQLIQLGQMPRARVIQTSAHERGQVYMPFVNWTLMLATVALVLGFRSSSALAAAYGIAVATTMVITSVLAFFVARRFGWHLLLAAAVVTPFLLIDSVFFAANLFKVADGGWYPISVAVAMFVIMTTWAHGRRLLLQHWGREARPVAELQQWLSSEETRQSLHRIPGTAVFFTPNGMAPPHMLRHLRRHLVLQQTVVLLTVCYEARPRVPEAERLRLIDVSPELRQMSLHYGFIETPDIPLALRGCAALEPTATNQISYYVGRETVIPSAEVRGMALWREVLFAFLLRNALRATAFFQLPPDAVVELGFLVVI
ncbi:KUP system potassium uptake protein [Solimonas aquatica]|uniref:Probable potassium transport system protein Kup n=1 Tax=Solimonas aquatica TaxID=489703 RepID=A0A1H9MD89_9GAMM|nr:potassium transporter Kup [Solimonas aquatica]SER21417.1 KUP system potassium uptake protein [Solimonas aquatica]